MVCYDKALLQEKALYVAGEIYDVSLEHYCFQIYRQQKNVFVVL
jgi:hypothetical protein